MHTGSFTKFAGEIESDETFIGGKARNMHKSRRKQAILGTGGMGKAVVHGILERGDEEKKSRVRANVVTNTKRKTLLPVIRENVEPGSAVYTDALRSYNGLSAEYVHSVIDHAEAYVNGRVHTNGMENFWSLLKRAIKGTYVAVDEPHLCRYVDEEVFRFNERKMNDGQRFKIVLPGTIGKRITYKELIGKNEAENLPGSDGAGNAGLPN